MKTFETLRGHLRARDWGAVYDMLSAAERGRVESRVESMREELARRKSEPALLKKYEEIAKAFGVNVAELETLSPREHFIRGTENNVKRNPASSGPVRWADAEVAEPPRVDGRRCAIVVRLPDGRREVSWLSWEDERWRLALREPPR